MLKLCLKGCEKKKNISNEWLVNWSNNWTDSAIKQKVEAWQRTGCHAITEQREFTAHVCAYLKIIHRAVIGHKRQIKVSKLFFWYLNGYSHWHSLFPLASPSLDLPLWNMLE